jgi:hypothetical protein
LCVARYISVRLRARARVSAVSARGNAGTALETQRLQKILSARVSEQKDVGQLGLLECDDGREAIRRSVVALPASSPISTSRPYKRDVRKDLRPPAPASTPYPWPPGIHKNVGDLVMLTSHGVCAKAPMVTPRVGDRVRLNPDSRQCSNSTALQGTLMHVKASGAFRFQVHVPCLALECTTVIDWFMTVGPSRSVCVHPIWLLSVGGARGSSRRDDHGHSQG